MIMLQEQTAIFHKLRLLDSILKLDLAILRPLPPGLMKHYTLARFLTLPLCSRFMLLK